MAAEQPGPAQFHQRLRADPQTRARPVQRRLRGAAGRGRRRGGALSRPPDQRRGWPRSWRPSSASWRTGSTTARPTTATPVRPRRGSACTASASSACCGPARRSACWGRRPRSSCTAASPTSKGCADAPEPHVLLRRAGGEDRRPVPDHPRPRRDRRPAGFRRDLAAGARTSPASARPSPTRCRCWPPSPRPDQPASPCAPAAWWPRSHHPLRLAEELAMLDNPLRRPGWRRASPRAGCASDFAFFPSATSGAARPAVRG